MSLRCSEPQRAEGDVGVVELDVQVNFAVIVMKSWRPCVRSAGGQNDFERVPGDGATEFIMHVPASHGRLREMDRDLRDLPNSPQTDH